MKLLVFQHIDSEHPGSLRDFLAADNIACHTVKFDQGDAIPPLQNYDALWVMGGPMDVWEIKQYPWLIAEKKAIREWVLEKNKPFLGLCLGHQLLADALGGICDRQEPPEIGIFEVELTENAANDPLFKNLSQKQKCLQWHSVCVTQAPKNTTILASSDNCRIQAMRVGSNAWSMQYHVEVEADTVTNWGNVPAYRKALEDTLGPDGLATMVSDANNHMPNFYDCAKTLYQNFMKRMKITPTLAN